MMRMRCAAVILACALPAGVDAAETFPARAVRLVVPFPPGAALDVVGRAMAQKLTERWSRSMVVDNRPGVAGTLGAEIVVKSVPDGYTLLIAGIGSLGTASAMYPKLAYDPLRDFAPVILIARAQSVLLVQASLPFRNVRELIAYAKANPGKLNYSSGGNGSTGHLGMETFKNLAGLDIVHVAHKGPAQGVIALATGEVQLSIQSQLSAGPLVQSGRVRIIAGTGARRLAELPDLPVVAEDLPGYEFYVWYGVTVPSRTPAATVALLNREIKAVFQLPELREMLTAQGSEIVLGSEAEFGAFLKREVGMWNTVIRAAGLRHD